MDKNSLKLAYVKKISPNLVTVQPTVLFPIILTRSFRQSLAEWEEGE